MACKSWHCCHAVIDGLTFGLRRNLGACNGASTEARCPTEETRRRRGPAARAVVPTEGLGGKGGEGSFRQSPSASEDSGSEDGEEYRRSTALPEAGTGNSGNEAPSRIAGDYVNLDRTGYSRGFDGVQFSSNELLGCVTIKDENDSSYGIENNSTSFKSGFAGSPGFLPEVTATAAGESSNRRGSSRYNCRNRAQLIKCDTCGKCFSNPSSLKSHEAVHRLGELKPFHCSECQRNYASQASYERHFKQHSNSACKYCGRKVSNSDAAQTGEICTQCCRKVYLRNCVPKLTIQTSTGRGRPKKFTPNEDVVEVLGATNVPSKVIFTCDECGKGFKFEARYKYHLNCHTRKETNPYVCRVCGDKFGAANGLRNHEVKHMKALPFKCDLCELKFKMEHHLRHHRTTHFKSSKFACKKCGKQFGSFCSLRTHEKKSSHEVSGRNTNKKRRRY